MKVIHIGEENRYAQLRCMDTDIRVMLDAKVLYVPFNCSYTSHVPVHLNNHGKGKTRFFRDLSILKSFC